MPLSICFCICNTHSLSFFLILHLHKRILFISLLHKRTQTQNISRQFLIQELPLNKLKKLMQNQFEVNGTFYTSQPTMLTLQIKQVTAQSQRSFSEITTICGGPLKQDLHGKICSSMLTTKMYPMQLGRKRIS